MPLLIPDLPDMRVFEWLGEDANGVPFYLHPLNLVWSAGGAESDLQVFRWVAERLALDPPYWAAIIRADSWRHSLAGCACLLSVQRRDFVDDLWYRFQGGSWVAPQIAVTLGLLHARQAKPLFESALASGTLSEAKQVVSAHRVLERLGARNPSGVLLDGLKQGNPDDAMIADDVVQKHWTFWSSRM